MEDIFTYRSYIEDRLTYHLSQKKTQSSYHILKKLVSYGVRGKMVRGCLVVLGHKMFGGKTTESVYDIACAVELLHSGLLIHDDIIDKDDMRRRKLSMHRLYEKDMAHLSVSGRRHYGISQALCTGDIAFFWGVNMLASAQYDKELKAKIISLWSRDLIDVEIAEMQEQRMSLTESTIKKEDILSLYVDKTGRYTFSLPLITGAHLAGTSTSTEHKLMVLGEVLGILFQIKDDELSLFGDPKRTGKPIGGDIREGKKTLYYYYLLQLLPEHEKEKMKRLFGFSALTGQDIVFVQNAILQYGIDKAVDIDMKAYATKAMKVIENLPITRAYQKILQALVDYSLVRAT